MKKRFPIINPDYHLHLTAEDCTLFNIVKSEYKNNSLGLKAFSSWRINPLMANYLTQCDGKTTHEEIVSNLKIPFSLLVDNGAKYLEEATQVLYFKEEEELCKDRLFVTGDFNSYNPLHVSIEITDFCNFSCSHCYVDASPNKLSKRSYEDMIRLMDTLWNNGVKVIELTGGECTTHPNFKEILRYASRKFNLVSIISNGYLLGKDKELAAFVGDLNNVTVQISIDGREEFHDKFRNKKNSFQYAVEAVKSLRAKGVLVRIASTITYDNIDQVDYLFHLSKSLGATAFAVSPVSALGRGICYSNCSCSDFDLKNKIDNILKPYSEDNLFKANKVSLENAIKSKEVNCGAGWRTFAINAATGNVRICLLTTDIGIIGNIDKEDYSHIFKGEKLNAYRLAPSPSPFLDTCKNCEYIEKCNSCMAKALDTYTNYNKACPWVKRYGITT